MPKLRIGTIPPTRLKEARLVRDHCKRLIGTDGYAIVSITHGGYSVIVRLFEGRERSDFPTFMNNIPIKITRIKPRSVDNA